MLPPFDVQAPLMSLPGIFGTSLESIPAQIPYLAAVPPLTARWRDRFANVPGLKVGIAWQGSPGFRGDRYRSIPLRHFAQLAKLPGIQLISLQKGPGREQLSDFSQREAVLDVAEELHDFGDTAAAMMNLDLVVSCDTAVGHLAGALGVPVWVALPFVPDWRWLLDRSDSPWYPTMRLFRQTAARDWAITMQEMQTALRNACMRSDDRRNVPDWKA
jgi:hypothetical protein